MPSTPIETDPAIVAGLIERNEASVAALRRDIRTSPGPRCSTSSWRTSRS